MAPGLKKKWAFSLTQNFDMALIKRKNSKNFSNYFEIINDEKSI
jgi:hypothetical protein